jgi:hypothetical protein
MQCNPPFDDRGSQRQVAALDGVHPRRQIL